jgi:hypothetical protein
MLFGSSNIKGTKPVTWIPFDLKYSTIFSLHCEIKFQKINKYIYIL